MIVARLVEPGASPSVQHTPCIAMTDRGVGSPQRQRPEFRDTGRPAVFEELARGSNAGYRARQR